MIWKNYSKNNKDLQQRKKRKIWISEKFDFGKMWALKYVKNLNFVST